MLSFILNIIVWIFFIAFYGALWALIVGVPILWILGCFAALSPQSILVGIVSAVLAWLILKADSYNIPLADNCLCPRFYLRRQLDGPHYVRVDVR